MSSPLLLAYGDQHCREQGSFPPFNVLGPRGFTRELENTLEGYRFVADTIRKVKPAVVVNVGDILHTTEYVSAMVLHAAALGLTEVTEACVEVGAEHHGIPGNHEIVSEKSGGIITSIMAFSGILTIHLEPAVLSVGDFRVELIPYTGCTEVAFAQLTSAARSADLIVTHLDFLGAVYESGKPSSAPLTPDVGCQVISGHIHYAQDIGDVHYVGSLVQHRFARSDLTGVAGVSTYNFETKKLKRYVNTYSKHYVRVDDDCTLARGVEPDIAVLQVFSERDRAELEEEYAGFEFHHVLRKETSEEGAPTREVTTYSSANPRQLLTARVTKERPALVPLVERILKKAKREVGDVEA